MPAHEERIGCDGRTIAVLIDDRYLRWRCTDYRNCEHAAKARRENLWAFHVKDLVTKKRTDEFEPSRLQEIEGRAA